MNILEPENKVAEIRERLLHMICVTREGKRRVMTLSECVESKALYLHIVADELDALLGVTLGGDDNAIA